MLQTLFKKESFSALGSTFLIFDVNGEYKKAFEKFDNKDIKVRNFTLDKPQKGEQKFVLPHYFLNVEEWELLLQATEKTQSPMLRNALGLASLFSKQDAGEIKKTKNHILATCITQILRDETSSPSKSDRIHSILRKFNTDDIKLTKKFKYKDESGTEKDKIVYDSNKTKDCSIENGLFVHFSEK